MATNIVFTKSLSAASATSIAASQAAVAGTPLTLTANPVVIDTTSANNIEAGRRVLITSTSATETASVTITGTNSSGSTISEVDTFSGASATLQSNLDYVSVISVVPSGTIVGSLSAGTNGVGSSRWVAWNWQLSPPLNIGYAVELVSGAINYTVQYTYDDPNNLMGGVLFPLPFNTILLDQTATADSTLSTPFIATRVLINSGTGVIRVRSVQAGIG
jgi:hypothetical protein